jgi:predicted acylesterase/phospholipase RssA
MIPPRHLVLSGGGIKVISIVGALRILEENNYMKHIKVISGVSAGAFLAFAVSIGLSIKLIEKLVIDLEFGVIRNMTPDAFLGFPETFGIDDGSKLRKFLESILRIAAKVDPQITFGDLASKPIQFKCWATDLNTHMIREFSLKETPSVRIIDALHASMAIPMYFTPVIDPITGHMLSDGGIQGALPIHHLNQEECDQCLAIGFCKPSVSDYAKGPDDLISFIKAIFACLVHSRHEAVTNKWKHKIILIPVNGVQSWDFEISRKDRTLLVQVGAETMTKWLASVKCGARQISRRFSV